MTRHNPKWAERLPAVEACLDKDHQCPKWTERLSVGVACLDEDHQAIFRLCALLEDLRILPGKGAEYLIETALNVLEESIDGHFLREQTAMLKADYLYLVEHIAAHDAFDWRVMQIVWAYRETHDRNQLATLCRLVTEWFTDHIQTMDAHYAGVLTSKNVDDRAIPCLTADL